MRRPSLSAQLLVAALAACNGSSEGGGGGSDLPGNTPCEKWDALATRKGCTPRGARCSVATACSDFAIQWLECVARDLSQCICETDGDLNCEGSFKPDEGPAKCIAEYTPFKACDRCGGVCDSGSD
jgi:hypothetical protein